MGFIGRLVIGIIGIAWKRGGAIRGANFGV